MFNGDELMNFVALADYVALNDYEAKLLQERTGKSLEQLAQNVRALIVTLGAKGSMIYSDGKLLDIPCVQAEQVIDPTGCGDAYRAGLLYGIVNGMDWETTGRLAALMGALKIASRGGQNHVHSRDEIASLFREQFGTQLE
jgi:adenosine kinase